jgi:hypothetical protein
VLDPALQDGKKLLKWLPRAQRGMFLGFSSKQSSTVGMVLNLVTGHVSPQYHVVYNEKFSTVTSTAAHAEALNVGLGTFTVDQWNDLLICGYDRHPALDEAIAENIPLPELALEWLSPVEIAEREDLHRHGLLRRRATGRVEDILDVPVPTRTVEVQDNPVVVPPIDTVAGPVPVVPVQPATVVQVPVALDDSSTSSDDDVPAAAAVPPPVPIRARRGENKNKRFLWRRVGKVPDR